MPGVAWHNTPHLFKPDKQLQLQSQQSNLGGYT